MSAHLNGPLGVATYDAWKTATPDDSAVPAASDLSRCAWPPQITSPHRHALIDWCRAPEDRLPVPPLVPREERQTVRVPR